MAGGPHAGLTRVCLLLMIRDSFSSGSLRWQHPGHATLQHPRQPAPGGCMCNVGSSKSIWVRVAVSDIGLYWWLCQMPPVLPLPPFSQLAHGADSLFTVDGAQPSILMTADLPIRDGPRLSSAVENGQGANKKKTTAVRRRRRLGWPTPFDPAPGQRTSLMIRLSVCSPVCDQAEEEEQSVSSRGKRSRDGVAAARGGATVERGGGGGTSDDKEEREGGGEGEDDDVDELASSVASCSVSGRDKKVRVTGSVSRQEERSLMARFRTVATNAFTDAEAGSETERLWGAAANAAREVSETHATAFEEEEPALAAADASGYRCWCWCLRAQEGTEPYTKLLDFLGGYRGCPANMSTEDEKLRMLKYLGKLRFGLPA